MLLCVVVCVVCVVVCFVCCVLFVPHLPPDPPSPDPPLPDRPPLDRPPPDRPKFRAFFFLLPLPFSFFFSLSGDLLVSFFSISGCLPLSGGLLVEFLVVFWSVGTSNVLVFSLGLSCGGSPPTACRPPGFHRAKQGLWTCTQIVNPTPVIAKMLPDVKHQTVSHSQHLKDFWLRAPTLSGLHPSGPHPSPPHSLGPPLLRVQDWWVSSRFWWVSSRFLVGVFKILGPLRWTSRRSAPLPRTAPSAGRPHRRTAQNFALFFFSPARNSFFLLSLGGLLVEFWWCF